MPKRKIYRCLQMLMTIDITHLMELELNTVTLTREEPANFEFRKLDAAEIRQFAGAESDLSADMATRAETGQDICFAALNGEQLAAYAWFAFSSIEAAHNRGTRPNSGVAMSFPANIAFMYKGYTCPEFRGRGLYGFVNAKALEYLDDFGIEKIISTADWSNASALQSCWRIGYQDLGLICRMGWGRLMTTRIPSKGKRIGVKFGKNADVTSRG